jgi:outer membrane protein
LDFSVPFEIQVPDVQAAEQVAVAAMQPEDIYLEARKHLGTIRSSELKLMAAQKRLAGSKGNLWPQLALSAQAGTNYSTTFKDYTVTGVTPTPVPGSYAVDTVGGSVLPLYQLSPVYTTSVTPLGKQLDNNFRQTVSLGLNIPLFNGWQAQYSVRQARINMVSQELNKYQAELKLKQDVYKAHNDARNSIQKFYAAQRAAEAAQRAFDFAQKRYDLGLTNTIEYLTTQNTLYTADARLASAKYDLIFKLKVIDYYLGKELKL